MIVLWTKDTLFICLLKLFIYLFFWLSMLYVLTIKSSERYWGVKYYHYTSHSCNHCWDFDVNYVLPKVPAHTSLSLCVEQSKPVLHTHFVTCFFILYSVLHCLLFFLLDLKTQNKHTYLINHTPLLWHRTIIVYTKPLLCFITCFLSSVFTSTPLLHSIAFNTCPRVSVYTWKYIVVLYIYVF